MKLLLFPFSIHVHVSYNNVHIERLIEYFPLYNKGICPLWVLGHSTCRNSTSLPKFAAFQQQLVGSPLPVLSLSPLVLYSVSKSSSFRQPSQSNVLSTFLKSAKYSAMAVDKFLLAVPLYRVLFHLLCTGQIQRDSLHCIGIHTPRPQATREYRSLSV